MKLLSLLLLTTISLSFTQWQTDFETAKRMAREQGKYILLNFSGSDWCGPCIRLKKEVFNSDMFEQFADSSLVLVNADFPRSKKHQYSKELQRHNEALADQYNPLGKFPFTLLLTADGKVIQTWEGYPNNSQLFIDRIKLACHDHSR
jgi:thioredoxin-related protein